MHGPDPLTSRLARHRELRRRDPSPTKCIASRKAPTSAGRARSSTARASSASSRPNTAATARPSPTGHYSAPALMFHSGRAAPVDLLSIGELLPGGTHGAFIVLHGTATRPGTTSRSSLSIRTGQAATRRGSPTASRRSTPVTPAASELSAHRQSPRTDGALYIADSQMGRVWRIAYDGRP